MNVVDLTRVRNARAVLDRLALERPDLLGGPSSVAEWEALLEGLETMADDAKTYGLDEVAAILGVHEETVRRAIRTGELAALKLPRNYRVSRAELARWWAAKGGGQLFDAEPVAEDGHANDEEG